MAKISFAINQNQQQLLSLLRMARACHEANIEIEIWESDNRSPYRRGCDLHEDGPLGQELNSYGIQEHARPHGSKFTYYEECHCCRRQLFNADTFSGHAASLSAMAVFIINPALRPFAAGIEEAFLTQELHSGVGVCLNRPGIWAQRRASEWVLSISTTS